MFDNGASPACSPGAVAWTKTWPGVTSCVCTMALLLALPTAALPAAAAPSPVLEFDISFKGDGDELLPVSGNFKLLPGDDLWDTSVSFCRESAAAARAQAERRGAAVFDPVGNACVVDIARAARVELAARAAQQLEAAREHLEAAAARHAEALALLRSFHATRADAPLDRDVAHAGGLVGQALHYAARALARLAGFPAAEAARAARVPPRDGGAAGGRGGGRGGSGSGGGGVGRAVAAGSGSAEGGNPFMLNPVVLAESLLSKRQRPFVIHTHHPQRCMYISASIWEDGFFDAIKSARIIDLMGLPGKEKGALFLDVGANIGWFTMLVAAQGHPVLAVEVRG